MSIEARFALERSDEFKLELDITLPGQGITAIFGASGCGKTTLLRAIAGLEPDVKGYLSVNGEVWQEDDSWLPTHQRSLGYIFQEPSLFDHLSVEDNLKYGLNYQQNRGKFGQQSDTSLEHAVELLGIGDLLKRKPSQLSGGEQQRVAIARALAISPRLLLMDEPLSALDEERKQEILPYLESLHSELQIPLLYVSHSLAEVSRLADHLVLLEAGHVKASGEIGQMLTRLDLPLAHQSQAESVIDVKLVRIDQEYGLAYARFTGGEFALPLSHGMGKQGLNQTVRLHIAARDVSLTLAQQSGTSILNIFAATIHEMNCESETHILLSLDIKGSTLLARITRKSADVLGLKVGMEVFAQIKSVALLAG